MATQWETARTSGSRAPRLNLALPLRKNHSFSQKGSINKKNPLQAMCLAFSGLNNDSPCTKHCNNSFIHVQ